MFIRYGGVIEINLLPTFNLLKGIEKTIRDNVGRALPDIGEKSEAIAERFHDRQVTTQEILKELEGLLKEVNEARKEQAESNIPPEVFSVYWMFKKEGVGEPEDNANKMKAVNADSCTCINGSVPIISPRR